MPPIRRTRAEIYLTSALRYTEALIRLFDLSTVKVGRGSTSKVCTCCSLWSLSTPLYFVRHTIDLPLMFVAVSLSVLFHILLRNPPPLLNRRVGLQRKHTHLLLLLLLLSLPSPPIQRLPPPFSCLLAVPPPRRLGATTTMTEMSSPFCLAISATPGGQGVSTLPNSTKLPWKRQP